MPSKAHGLAAGRAEARDEAIPFTPPAGRYVAASPPAVQGAPAGPARATASP
jgi:hypothetical protein